MFQSEIILFMQSGAGALWTAFFRFWTEIGNPSWSALALLILVFGFRFREGLILLQVVLWNALITGFFKEIFALPRPDMVDRRVLALGKEAAAPAVWRGPAATSFFGRLPGRAVEAARSTPPESWGFPSGHTSNAVVLWGGAALMLRKRSVAVLAGLMVLFVPLSRLYLGRHFLADVLGGYILGAACLAAFCALLSLARRLKGAGFFGRDRPVPPGPLPATAPSALGRIFPMCRRFCFVALPVLLSAVPQFDRGGLAALLGLNLGILALRREGLPENSGSPGSRSARTAAALMIFLGCGAGFRGFSRLLFASEPPWALFVRTAALVFLVVWGGTRLGLRAGWFTLRRETPPGP